MVYFPLKGWLSPLTSMPVRAGYGELFGNMLERGACTGMQKCVDVFDFQDLGD